MNKMGSIVIQQKKIEFLLMNYEFEIWDVVHVTFEALDDRISQSAVNSHISAPPPVYSSRGMED